MTLIDIKDFLDDTVQSFAAILDLELTIICSNPLQRVAGTGDYKDPSMQLPTSDHTWKNTYSKQVIENGKTMVVIDTLEFRRTTTTYHFSEYYSLLIVPICLMNQVEGVLVLASFTKEQQQILIENKNEFLHSLEKISELIASKLEQQILQEKKSITLRQLKMTMEAASMGLVLCELPNKILQINNLAKQYLHFKDKHISEQLLEKVFDLAQQTIEVKKSIEREIHATYGTVIISIIIKIHPIENSNSSVLCMIDQFKHVQDAIVQNDGTGFFGGEIITSDPVMIDLIDRVKTAAKHSSNILILGESGTGKELFARMIHNSSDRRSKPFVSINCAAIPESLLESELFGYVDGAFTGARKGGKIGKFLLANGGTLFLDEIGDMPLYLQAKILRVLSDHKVDRLGGTNSIDVDVRIVAATNQNIEEMVLNREFREDLYYRLNVISFTIPPLRDRKDDIIILAKYFIKKYSNKVNKDIHGMTMEVQGILMQYSWPGNVRELENVIEYMITFENYDIITKNSLPSKLRNKFTPVEEICVISTSLGVHQTKITNSLKEILHQKEREVLIAMRSSYGEKLTTKQVKKICKTLKISVASYYRKVAELGLNDLQE